MKKVVETGQIFRIRKSRVLTKDFKISVAFSV